MKRIVVIGLGIFGINDAVAQHATDDVQRLVDGDPRTGAHEIGGAGQPGGAGADDGDAPEAGAGGEA